MTTQDFYGPDAPPITELTVSKHSGEHTVLTQTAP